MKGRKERRKGGRKGDIKVGKITMRVYEGGRERGEEGKVGEGEGCRKSRKKRKCEE